MTDFSTFLHITHFAPHLSRGEFSLCDRFSSHFSCGETSPHYNLSYVKLSPHDRFFLHKHRLRCLWQISGMDHHAHAKIQSSQNMSALKSIDETREVWCFGGEKLKLLHICLLCLDCWSRNSPYSRIPMQSSLWRNMKYNKLFFLCLFFSQLQVWHGGNLSPIQTGGKVFGFLAAATRGNTKISFLMKRHPQNICQSIL